MSIFKVAGAVVDHGCRFMLVQITTVGSFSLLYLNNIVLVLQVLRVLMLLDFLPLKGLILTT